MRRGTITEREVSCWRACTCEYHKDQIIVDKVDEGRRSEEQRVVSAQLAVRACRGREKGVEGGGDA